MPRLFSSLWQSINRFSDRLHGKQINYGQLEQMDSGVSGAHARKISLVKSKKWVWLTGGAGLVLLVSCLFMCLTGTALFFLVSSSSNGDSLIDQVVQDQREADLQSTSQIPDAAETPETASLPGSLTQSVVPPTDGALPADSMSTGRQVEERLTKINPPELIDREPLVPGAAGHLKALLAAEYPARDDYEVAKRFGNIDITARTVYHGAFIIGDTQSFWTGQGSTTASLLAISPHAYFWFDSSLSVDSMQVQEVSNRFAEDYYPRITELWGQEWRPGVDNDPRFSILHLASFTDDDELGYFDSGDEYPLTINSSSNEQEIVYLNMAAISLGSDIYYATLSHELQHLIHWYNDPNEEVWLNEGLSQLTELLLDFDTVDTQNDYAANPNIQLNSWEYDDEDGRNAHYGAGYLVSVYLWEELGAEGVIELARSPENGVASILHMLEKYQPDTDLAAFFADWSLTNFLDNDETDPYFYRLIDFDRPTYSAEINSTPAERIDQIEQFSAAYIKLDLRDEINLSFVGDRGTALIDAPPHSGNQMWFAPAANNLDAHLIREFDLSGVARANLQFWAWYDLEPDFDLAYISVSADGGDNWDSLDPLHGHSGEFGSGLSGRSSDETDQINGWLFETISLDRYTGQVIQIRFDLVTDSAIPGVGLAIDDIALPEIGFFDDVEKGPNSWNSAGFVQSGWRIHQGWSLYIIQETPYLTVTPLPLDANNSGSWTIDLRTRDGVLVISATAPFSTKSANYWLAVESTISK